MSFWNFPSVTGGNINSINNAGLETFRDNVIDSLTREICQNSLDAVKNNDEPVVVEFSKFTIDIEKFPNKSELLSVFKKCINTWEGKNKQVVEFAEKAIQVLNENTMPFLRISDFNTKGLKGAKTAELGLPWSSLVKEAGSSNKEGDSGGSFGIGKAAPIVNSQIRTLFYSSFDEENYQSHIGVSDIMSYKEDNGEITLGKGYYTNDTESKAIEGLLNIDGSFTRVETGTDIFVSSFQPIVDWEKDIINAVLHNFFITVFQKKLIVKVNGFEINHENIEKLIFMLEDNEENRILKSYYLLLTSNETIQIKYPPKKYKNGVEFKDGEAILYLMNGDELNRRVLMTRKTGMRLFEQKNISGSISFTGILMIKGSNMNSIFKQMENPAHNGWSPARYEKDVVLAKKIYADLRKFIRQEVKELFSQNVTDVMDAVGLSDFLPDKTDLSDNGGEKKESITPTIKELTFKKKEQVQKKKMRKKKEKKRNVGEELVDEFGLQPGEVDEKNEHEPTNTDFENKSSSTHDNKKDNKKEGSQKEGRQRKNKPVSSKQKYICADKQNGEYTFLITTDKKINRGQLVFKLFGEQSDYDLPIKKAKFIDENVKVAGISGNVIDFSSNTKCKNFNLIIEVDYTDYCVMEVGVFEN